MFREPPRCGARLGVEHASERKRGSDAPRVPRQFSRPEHQAGSPTRASKAVLLALAFRPRLSRRESPAHAALTLGPQSRGGSARRVPRRSRRRFSRREGPAHAALTLGPESRGGQAQRLPLSRPRFRRGGSPVRMTLPFHVSRHLCRVESQGLHRCQLGALHCPPHPSWERMTGCHRLHRA